MLSKEFYEDFAESNKEVLNKLNASSKARLLNKKNTDWIAEAITEYILSGKDADLKDILTEHEREILQHTIDKKVREVIANIHDGKWLDVEMKLAYYHNERYPKMAGE